MPRQFGLSRRETVGGNQSPGSHIAPNTQRDNVIQLVRRLPPGTARLNSRSQEVEPFISPFELGSHFLFLALMLLPVAIVGGIAIGYLAVVPELVEYQSSVEAYRFKAH